MNKIVKSEHEWRELLSDLAFAVTRKGATERPFSGTLLHNNQQGTYHCVCCNQTLFSSQAKFDAGCGWPSFDRAAENKAVKFLRDTSHNMERVEVRCSRCDAHLGHVFNDGPTDTKERFCINSAALDFTAEDNDSL
ncbi:peptide-methionine (R)-S-oxide reductase MsrB [Agarivorans sp.]|uniref:peptide-methionine (R)-S-oxide reductase MsrB n=1 Tax=Agarivorans sp. TaxID=1872412 RepID=UPI003CFF05A7